MGSHWISYVVIILLAVGGVAALYSFSFSKRMCPNCHTMMPKRVTLCPKCHKQIPLNY